VRRAVYAFIVIIILAFAGGLPAYLVLGQGGNQSAIVTVTAQPAYSSSGGGGGGWLSEAECPAGEVSTTGRVTGTGSVTRAFVIKSFDKRFSLIIDEGIVVLTPHGQCPRCIGIHEMAQTPSSPEGAHIIGVMYDVVPDETTFTPPATLKYSYELSEIPEGISEEGLLIACYNGATGEWIKLDSVVDAEASTVTAKVSQIYDLAILGYEPVVPMPAAFECGCLSITPTEVYISETVNITVLVTNTGGQSGDYLVMFKINGVAEAVSEVVLDAGASEEVSFTTSEDTAGTYLVDVNGLTGTFEVKPEPLTPVIPMTPVEPTPAKPMNWWLTGGVIAAAAAAAVAIYLYRVRLSPLYQRSVYSSRRWLLPLYQRSVYSSRRWLLPLYQRSVNLSRRWWSQIRRVKKP
jgi:hypothetical protein